MRIERRPIIGLLGGGTKLSAERTQLARDLGAMIGSLGAHLLMSASFAVAEAVSEGFSSVPLRRGIAMGNLARDVAGVLDKSCCADDGTPYSSRCVELAIFTRVDNLDAPRTQWRSRINLLTCDAIVALPGATATRAEVDAAFAGNGVEPDRRAAFVLVGPAEEFPPELRSTFILAVDARAAETHLCRQLASLGFFLVHHRRAPLAGTGRDATVVT